MGSRRSKTGRNSSKRTLQNTDIHIRFGLRKLLITPASPLGAATAKGADAIPGEKSDRSVRALVTCRVHKKTHSKMFDGSRKSKIGRDSSKRTLQNRDIHLRFSLTRLLVIPASPLGAATV